MRKDDQVFNTDKIACLQIFVGLGVISISILSDGIIAVFWTDHHWILGETCDKSRAFGNKK